MEVCGIDAGGETVADNSRYSNGLGDVVNIQISPAALNQFLGVYYAFRSEEAQPIARPQGAIRRRLKAAVKIGDSFWTYENWDTNNGQRQWLRERMLFEVKDRVLCNTYLLYALTRHATERLMGRFKISKNECAIRAAVEIATGHVLSHTEKRKYHTTHNTDAVRYENRIYLIRANTIVTVIDGDNRLKRQDAWVASFLKSK